MEDKKSAAVREGALLCLEGLTMNLGRLFEPYVVSSLPLLLQAFSDSQQSVRNASQVAAGAMMSQLSGPGVKQARSYGIADGPSEWPEMLMYGHDWPFSA